MAFLAEELEEAFEELYNDDDSALCKQLDAENICFHLNVIDKSIAEKKIRAEIYCTGTIIEPEAEIEAVEIEINYFQKFYKDDQITINPGDNSVAFIYGCAVKKAKVRKKLSFIVNCLFRKKIIKR